MNLMLRFVLYHARRRCTKRKEEAMNVYLAILPVSNAPETTKPTVSRVTLRMSCWKEDVRKNVQ